MSEASCTKRADVAVVSYNKDAILGSPDVPTTGEDGEHSRQQGEASTGGQVRRSFPELSHAPQKRKQLKQSRCTRCTHSSIVYSEKRQHRRPPHHPLVLPLLRRRRRDLLRANVEHPKRVRNVVDVFTSSATGCMGKQHQSKRKRAGGGGRSYLSSRPIRPSRCRSR